MIFRVIFYVNAIYNLLNVHIFVIGYHLHPSKPFKFHNNNPRSSKTIIRQIDHHGKDNKKESFAYLHPNKYSCINIEM
jgi:hypothetical protein